MRIRIIELIAAVFIILVAVGTAAAHCEVPCGIYDDKLRTDLIAEHITTDKANIDVMRSLLKEFEILYFGHSPR